MSFIKTDSDKNIQYTDFNSELRPWKLYTTSLHHDTGLYTDPSYIDPTKGGTATSNPFVIEASGGNINFYTNPGYNMNFYGDASFANNVHFKGNVAFDNYVLTVPTYDVLVSYDNDASFGKAHIRDSLKASDFFEVANNKVEISSNSVLSIPGILDICDNVTINSKLNVKDISLSGHIIPTLDETYDIGSSTHKIRDIYLSSGTLYMGTSGTTPVPVINFDGNTPRFTGVVEQPSNIDTLAKFSNMEISGNILIKNTNKKLTVLSTADISYADISYSAISKLKVGVGSDAYILPQTKGNTGEVLKLASGTPYQLEWGTTFSSNWTKNGNNIHFPTYNVGINTDTPSETFDVSGASVLNNLKISNAADAGWGWTAGEGEIVLGRKAVFNNTSWFLRHDNTGDTYLNAASTRKLYFNIGNSTKTALTWEGNFGIGLTNPTKKIEVIGDISCSNIISIGYDKNRTSHIGKVAIGFAGIYNFASFSHIKNCSDISYAFGQMFTGETTINSPHLINFKISNSPKMILLNNGNFGIGTQQPTAKLEVVGDVSCASINANNFNTSDICSNTLYTNKIYSKTTNSDISICGKLDISGDALFNNKLEVNDDASFNSKLDVSGDFITGHLKIVNKSSIPGWEGSEGIVLGLKNNLNNTNYFIRHDANGKTFFNSAAGKSIDFKINAIDKMKITETGRLGIGINSPQALLHVNGDASFNGAISAAYDTNTTSYLGRVAIGYVGHGDYAGIAHIDSNNTSSYALIQSTQGVTILNAADTKYIDLRINNSTKVRLASNGNLGIGTEQPTAKLEVIGDISCSGIVSIVGDISCSGIISMGGDLSINALSVAYDTNKTSYFGRAAIGYNTQHSDWASFAHIDSNAGTDYALVQDSLGTTAVNAAATKSIDFRINNSNKMKLTTSGNLGIGTDTPSKKLHVTGEILSTSALSAAYNTNTTCYLGKAAVGWNNIDTNSACFTHVNFINNTDYALLQTDAGATNLNTKGDQDLYFNVGADNKMIMKYNGNIGIGLNNPTKKLEVIGDASFSGSLNIKNFSVNDICCNNELYTDKIYPKTTNSDISMYSNLDISGYISAANDTDITSYLGKATIGYINNLYDYATFSHTDCAINTDFALSQDNSGSTFINAKLDEKIAFQHNGSTKMVINNSGLGIGLTNPTKELEILGDISCSGALNCNGNIQTDGLLTTTSTAISAKVLSPLIETQSVTFITGRHMNFSRYYEIAANTTTGVLKFLRSSTTNTWRSAIMTILEVDCVPAGTNKGGGQWLGGFSYNFNSDGTRTVESSYITKTSSSVPSSGGQVDLSFVNINTSSQPGGVGLKIQNLDTSETVYVRLVIEFNALDIFTIDDTAF